MKEFDTPQAKAEALDRANDWLLRIAAEHCLLNLANPLMLLFAVDLESTLLAATKCDAFNNVLPELVAREALPRAKIIEAFRTCREFQSDEESARAAEGLDRYLAFRRRLEERERRRSESFTPVREWLDDTGFTAEQVLERLHASGRVTIDLLDEIFLKDVREIVLDRFGPDDAAGAERDGDDDR